MSWFPTVIFGVTIAFAGRATALAFPKIDPPGTELDALILASVADSAPDWCDRCETSPFEASFLKGMAAYENLDLETAISEIDLAIAWAQLRPESVRFEQVLKAYATLAAASFRASEERLAKSVLAELLVLAPNFEPPLGSAPAFVYELERSRLRHSKRKSTALRIQGATGASIFVDGRSWAADRLTQLPQGGHFVTLKTSDQQWFGTWIDLGEQPVTLDAQLKIDRSNVATVNSNDLTPTENLAGKMPSDLVPMAKGSYVADVRSVEATTAWARVPRWVWIGAAAAAIVGAGIGGTAAIVHATRPVTGTIVTSW